MARVLVLTSRLPYPPREGHQLRSWHLLRAVAQRHEVSLLSFQRRDDVPAECAPLRAVLARLETFPIRGEHSRLAFAGDLAKSVCGMHPFVAEKYDSLTLRVRLAELLPHVDLLHVDMLPLMRLAPAGSSIPLVFDAQNVEHLLLRQRARHETGFVRRIFLRSQVPKLRRFERNACRRADHVLACSRDDAAELSALSTDSAISVVPNGVDVDACAPANAIAHPARLVFVGQMSWFPNLDGVQWFLREVLPRILATRPDARFTLVGKNAGLRVPHAVRDNVCLAGFVDELRDEIGAASVYVVPLRCGSGTRLKVLEAMAFGKAIVTTTIGSQGIDLEPGREALFADDAERFAAAVLSLLADPARALRMGAAARAKAIARYDWRAIGRELLAVYDELLRTPAVDRLADELVDRRFGLAQR